MKQGGNPVNGSAITFENALFKADGNLDVTAITVNDEALQTIKNASKLAADFQPKIKTPFPTANNFASGTCPF